MLPVLLLPSGHRVLHEQGWRSGGRCGWWRLRLSMASMHSNAVDIGELDFAATWAIIAGLPPGPARPPMTPGNQATGPMASAPLIFLHIPRTGGTTLRSILRRQNQGAEFSVAATVSAHLGRKWMDVPASEREQYARSVLLGMTPQERAEITLLEGHMDFGWHALLGRPARYVALAREPVERMVSLYRYVLGLPRHPHRAAIQERRLSVVGYMESGLAMTADNGMIRRLSGLGNAIPFGQCTREHLDLARRNLREHFLIVGPTGRFDEFLLYLERALVWQARPFYARENASHATAELGRIEAADIAGIKSLNALDCELFESIQADFTTKIAEEFDDMPDALARFREENARFRPRTSFSPWRRLGQMLNGRRG